MPKMTGARFIAETVHGYGITHVFFMPYIGPRGFNGDGKPWDQTGSDAR